MGLVLWYSFRAHELLASKNRIHMHLTLLGWCIAGPMHNQNKSEKSSYNRTMVKSVVTAIPANHYFTQSDTVRDTSIETILLSLSSSTVPTK